MEVGCDIDRVLAREAESRLLAIEREAREPSDSAAFHAGDDDRCQVPFRMLPEPNGALLRRPRVVVGRRDGVQDRVVVDGVDGREVVHGGVADDDGHAGLNSGKVSWTKTRSSHWPNL
jgi:hypothetical protein